MDTRKIGLFPAGVPPIIAGPCAVENLSQMEDMADIVHKAGCLYIRGGAYKPRTHHYSYQGLGEEGLALLTQTAHARGLRVVTELLDLRHLPLFQRYGVDVIQIGSRNMYNYPLLKECGRLDKPILLKRHFSATLEEWFAAAEYIAAEGQQNIILCERGIRSFEPSYRNVLDLQAVLIAQKTRPWPVIVDPSHACGHAWMVPPLAKAAMALGADGLLVEVHPHPAQALSDKEQALNPEEFYALMKALKTV